MPLTTPRTLAKTIELSGADGCVVIGTEHSGTGRAPVVLSSPAR